MKTKLFLFLTIFTGLVLLSSCEKNESKEGYIQCTNISSDMYDVFIQGNTTKSFTLSSKEVKTITVEPGYYVVSVTQMGGYLFIPTKQSFPGTVKQGQTMYVVFPE